MVDRQQEQARLAVEEMGASGRAGKDLSWIVAACVLLTVVIMATGAATALLDWVDGLSGSGTNAMLALVVLIPVGSTIYAMRRYRDAANARELLRELSFKDSLTGLPNRRFLGEGFDAMLAAARRTNGHVGVFFVDLDGFKRINDTYGHEAGDEVMVTVADRMQKVIGEDDVIVRYGGDEFVVLAPDLPGSASAERRARSMIRAVEEPITYADAELRLSASVGIALTETRCSHPDEVLSDADAAMYRAKARGPGRYALFDRGARDRFTPSTAERRLRLALDKGEFRLYYQPVVSLWTKRLVGLEALLRWKDPDAGLVSPDEFMPALEDTGLIVPVGGWVLNEVCRQSHQWQARFPDRPALNIKVNISARQLAQADFCSQLRSTLSASGAKADSLCLEVAESAMSIDIHAAWATLAEAKTLGVTVALDDFGTGYSSLAYLRELAIDLLIIDKTFIDGIGISREDTTIVEHLIGMAKALGIVTVAQGVETEAQIEQLKELSCDLAQGYYFSHAQPPEVISTLLENDGNGQEWRPLPTDETDDADDADGSAPVVLADRFIT